MPGRSLCNRPVTAGAGFLLTPARALGYVRCVSTAKIEITAPRLLTAGAVFVLGAYTLLLRLPVLFSLLVVSVHPFGIWTFLLPLLAFTAFSYFLPFGSGNPHVAKLVHALVPAARAGQEGFVVQLTLTPRIRSDLRAWLEDADDIGWLSFTPSEVVFEGDSVKLRLPYEEIRHLEAKTIGWRGLFLYRPRILIGIAQTRQFTALEVTERSSWILPTARRAARQMYERLAQNLAAARAPAGAAGS